MSVHLFDPVKKRNNKLKMDTFAPSMANQVSTYPRNMAFQQSEISWSALVRQSDKNPAIPISQRGRCPDLKQSFLSFC